MKSYEAMFIFRPGLTEDQQKALVDKMENVLKDNQAEIRSSETFGRRALAYEVNKQKEGLYYLIEFSSKPGSNVVGNLKNACKINEDVIRVLVLSKQAQKPSAG